MDEGPSRAQPYPKGIRTAALLTLIAASLQACGGGGTDAPPANRAPTLDSIVEQSVEEGGSIDVTFAASDRDGDALTFDAPQLPDFITAENLGDGNWRLSVAPGFEDAGDYAIDLRVTDPDGAVGETRFTLHVLDVNRAPTLATIGDLAVFEGQSQSVVLSASDPDGDGVTFSSADLPAFITLTDHGDGTAGFAMQPGYFASGAYAITVQVADSGGLGDESSFTVTVNDINRAPLLSAVADIAIAEGEIREIPLAAVDPDGDAISLSVSGLPAFASATDDGNGSGRLAIAPGFFDSGVYPVIVRAADSGELVVEMSFAIVVGNVNRTPSVGSQADLSLAEGQTLTVALSATDPDGDSLALNIANLPPFATFTDHGDGTGSLDIEPGFDDAGDFALLLRAADTGAGLAETRFRLTIADVNREPLPSAVPDQSLDEGETRTITLEATDPDGDDLVLDALDLPAFATFADHGDGTGSLDTEPGFDDAGTYSLSFRVSDSHSAVAELGFEITVDDVNREPLPSAVPDQLLGEGETLTVALTATDPDGDSLALSIAKLPAFATLSDHGDGTASLDLQPGFEDAGTFALTLRATDAAAAFAEADFRITVGNVNREPALTAITDQTLAEGELLSIALGATDPDGDNLVLSIAGLPAFATLSDHGDGTASLDLQPGFDDAGAFALMLRATDTELAVAETGFQLTVSNVNRAPALAVVPDQAVAEAETLTLALSATDPDGDSLVLSMAGLPAFATLSDHGDGTASLDLQPGFEDAGTFELTLRATDTESAIAETGFQLTVANVNREPSPSAVPDQTLGEGETLTIALDATDPDGDILALSIANLPAFATLSDHGDGTASLDLQPGFEDAGTFALTLRATDGAAAFAETGFELTIADVNRAPALATLADQAVVEAETLTVALSATDPDGDSLAFSITNLPPFATLTDHGDGTANLDLQPGYDDAGTYALNVRATDVGSAVAEAELHLTVGNVNREPSWTAVPDLALNEGETLSVALSAGDPDGDSISLSSVGLPAFVSLLDNGDGTGSLDLQPGFTASGIYPVAVQATDELAAVGEFDFYITVGDVNQPPAISTIGNPTLAEGERLVASFDASDPDGDNISFDADGLPDFVTLNDYGNGQADLRMEPRIGDAGVYTFVVRATDTGFPGLTDEKTVQVTVNLDGANHVASENSLPGTTDWRLDNPALQREIEGYASATSVNRGEKIAFYVNTTAPTFTLEVFRTGWYQGKGARRVLGPIDIPGTVQITPTPDPVTGLVEADWINPYEVQTSNAIASDAWTTGVYLARLTESDAGKQSYIIFVLREDGERHDVLFQLPVTTYQAYNAWGGKSLYDFNSGSSEPWGATSGTRASHVSFDRPYARNDYDPAAYGMGAGEYLTNVQPVGRIDGAGWDYNMVRWLEYEQYDVAYITSIDTHRSPYGLMDTEVFLSQGHDEYWSWEMRDNVEAARDFGVDLAFFSSNAGYAQVRFEPSPTTADPDRVMVAYKNELLDPVFSDADPLNDHLTTVPFRYLPVPRPEEALIGVQYVLDPYDGDIIVTNPSHWVFTYTGLLAGSRLRGLLGYEPDGMFGGGPANIEVLAETPIVSSDDPSNTGTSHMTIYKASRAFVFATGSLQWSWGLDDYNVPQMRTSRLSAAAQQITSNVLEVFGAIPRMGDAIEAQCVRIVSYADADNDETMAAAEFDVLDQYGYPISKSELSVYYVDSEESVGMDGSALYAIDGDPTTFWQTQWYGLDHPHEIQIRFDIAQQVTGLRYWPRQDGSLDGTVTDYEVFTSDDFFCSTWSLAAAGTWEPNSGRKLTRFER